MSEYLTQRAIDALFAGSDEAEGPRPPEPRPFILRQARGLSRPQLQVLETTFGGFAEALQAFFTFRLHRQLRISLVMVEQVKRSEFLLSLPAPCAAFEFRLRPGSEERGLLDLGTPFVLYSVDCMLGGPGGAAASERRLTRIEQEIGRKVAGLVLARLGSALAERMPLAPEIVSFESNPEMLTASSAEDPVLAVLLEMADDAFSGLVALALPAASVHALAAGSPAEPEDRRFGASSTTGPGSIEQNLRLARVGLSVRMPPFGLSARDIARLRAGDVIDTGLRSDTRFVLCLNETPAFLGALGQVHRRIGLKIIGPTTETSGERRDPDRKGRLL